MSLLQAYLQSSKTRQILSRKPGEKGFSLIELVVVIGVLAVLTAVALPNFIGVSDDAAVRSAQQAMTSYFKECSVLKARGNYSNDPATNPVIPAMSDFTVGSATGVTIDPSSTAANNLRSGTVDPNDCFKADNKSDLANVAAFPDTQYKFPIFVIESATGKKICFNGNNTAATAKTYSIGCVVGGGNGAEGTW